jgi:hypothetical protein
MGKNRYPNSANAEWGPRTSRPIPPPAGFTTTHVPPRRLGSGQIVLVFLALAVVVVIVVSWREVLAPWVKGAVIGLGVLIAARVLWRTGLHVYDEVADRMHTARIRRVQLDRERVIELRPDERGRLPAVLVASSGEVRDLNNGRLFNVLHPGDAQLDPQLELADQMPRALAAAGGWPSHRVMERFAPQIEEAMMPPWPRVIALEDLQRQYGHRPSLHSLLLGVTHDGQTWQPVLADMSEMVHVLVSGGSKFGKSTLLTAMAKQLAQGDDCDLAFVDYGVNTFSELSQYSRWPIADTPELAEALFRRLLREMHRRRALFKELPAAKDLDGYNQVTGSRLRPIVAFVDETSALLGKGGTRDPLIELSQMGRKFGLGLVLAGQDFKATTLPSEGRGNLGARIAFHLEPGLSRAILYSALASNLNDPGRALMLLPGRPMVEVQCPMVGRWDDLPPARGEILDLDPVEVEPEQEDPIDAADDPGLPDDERIRRLHQAGVSKRQIAIRVYGYAGGSAFGKVDRALGSSSITDIGEIDLSEERVHATTTLGRP